jgi:nucleoside-diphosphate-sugar epimerase
MSKILITGGAGSFGRQLASILHEKGHLLKIFDLESCNYSFYKDWDNTFILPGDITQASSIKNAVKEVDMVFHLAAILPPASEIDKKRTFRVNVEGTRILLDVLGNIPKTPDIIFTSSVSVYGDTSKEGQLIGQDHRVNPNDWYAESKAEAEQMLFSSNLPYVNLRISGVVIPAFLDPPDPWAFQEDQKIELICLTDLTSAMASLAGNSDAIGKNFILAGGKSWQVKGKDYVQRWGEIMEIPYEEMNFPRQPGWLNWYDTDESQRLLNYQKTSIEDFYVQLSAAVKEALM